MTEEEALQRLEDLVPVAATPALEEAQYERTLDTYQVSATEWSLFSAAADICDQKASAAAPRFAQNGAGDGAQENQVFDHWERRAKHFRELAADAGEGAAVTSSYLELVVLEVGV
jgi:hypothetical protein